MYTKEERLVLNKKVAITEEAYKALRTLKRLRGISMAKIVSSLILEECAKPVNKG